MISAVGFLRLADRVSAIPPNVRKVIEHLAQGDSAAAAAAAGGKGTDDWWAAEFFLSALAAEGILPSTPRQNAPRTDSLFAD